MLIFGHPHIPAPILHPIATPEEIDHLPPDHIPLLPFDFALANYCLRQGIKGAIWVETIRQGIYGNALQMAYLVSPTLKLAKELQQIADNYLFDARIIVQIDERLLEEAVAAQIDGVWLKERGRVGASFTRTS
ncbi:MAG: hypothetical protein C6I00_03270 [Nitratiruptor sp.]|nr:hypothetical protein [Nitratiruptor sp.]NPA83480.1 hypothetical protein [Campylobacterota bacterium]